MRETRSPHAAVRAVIVFHPFMVRARAQCARICSGKSTTVHFARTARCIPSRSAEVNAGFRASPPAPAAALSVSWTCPMNRGLNARRAGSHYPHPDRAEGDRPTAGRPSEGRRVDFVPLCKVSVEAANGRGDVADEELLERFRSGSARAFEELMRRHQTPLYNFILRRFGTPKTAEEIHQDAWLRILQGRAIFSGFRSSPRGRTPSRGTSASTTRARRCCGATPRSSSPGDEGRPEPGEVLPDRSGGRPGRDRQRASGAHRGGRRRAAWPSSARSSSCASTATSVQGDRRHRRGPEKHREVSDALCSRAPAAGARRIRRLRPGAGLTERSLWTATPATTSCWTTSTRSSTRRWRVRDAAAPQTVLGLHRGSLDRLALGGARPGRSRSSTRPRPAPRSWRRSTRRQPAFCGW